jgi:hypothetical protein
MGLIYATLGEHELAVEQFIAATSLDQYLAVAWVVSSAGLLWQRRPLANSAQPSVQTDTSNVAYPISF